MVRILLGTWGSFGDVNTYVALTAALKAVLGKGA